MPRILTIDPSICKLGWAVFVLPPNSHSGQLTSSGTIKLYKDKDKDTQNLEWVNRVDQMLIDLLQTLDEHEESRIHRVIIELPTHYSSEVGDAAKNSSAILKLMFLVATLRRSFLTTREPSEVILVPVAKWKGNAPKHITQRRVLKDFPTLRSKHPKPDHNELDAVGIGRWYLRNLRQKKI
jgi:hypothetical protein